MRTTTRVLLVLFCVAALGCAAAREEQQAALSAPTANVAGSWAGNAGSGGVSIPVSMSLTQNGTNVTGNLTVAARPDMSGPITGSITGEVLKVSLATRTFSELIVKGDTMSGQTGVGQVVLRRSR